MKKGDFMTLDEVKSCGIPIADEKPEALLRVYSGIEWLQQNTTLKIDMNNADTIASLPNGAKLFILKFCDLMSRSEYVTSESVGGLSQSFSSADKSGLLMDIAKQLIKPYMKSDFKFVLSAKRWN